MNTFSAKAEQVDRKWWIIDAKDQILGEVAVTAANVLRGKNKPIFTPHVDTGDYVVVINAAEVRLTGKKETKKVYTRVSGYVGSKKVETVEKVRERHPELLVERAVKGMVPHNSLGRTVLKKLKVYADDQHPHQGQAPTPLAIA
ncbi:MAG: ribosomal protein [Verrucomicrobiaceae bacterium]|nr:ribosomal protein [Verrucomicrobiaceae bacterium]MDB6116514.1 ribosomal protein [Verrucomicrobiaceae bacterium]